MCKLCNKTWLDAELMAMKLKLKNATKGHMDFYIAYIKILEDKQRRDSFKLVKGGKCG